MIVYLITNTKNGKRYVGITTNSMTQRWYEHCWLAAAGGTQALYRAMRKYGVDSFQIEQIDTADTLTELFDKERQHIKEFGTYTKLGHGYNMTLGGDGVFGFEFSEETRAEMTASAVARFADPVERERQRRRQEQFWTEIERAKHSEKIASAHRRNPDQARQHSEFMKQNSDPEQMRMRARLLWDAPGAKERFKRQKAEYWSDPANREKASREIKQRFASNPEYAKTVSEGKKRQYRENPEDAQRHSERMKKRFAENPGLSTQMRDQANRAYREDPNLISRMASSRKCFYERNPDARARASEVARDRAERRRALHAELTTLAEDFQSKTGEIFPIPSRSAGGWQEAVMLELIDRLKILLSTKGR